MPARSIAHLYHQYVGKRIAVDLGGGVEALAVVTDARVTWGNENLLVQMAFGVGSMWIQPHRVRIVDDDWPQDSKKIEECAKNVAAAWYQARRHGASIPKLLEAQLEKLIGYYDFIEPPDYATRLKAHEEAKAAKLKKVASNRPSTGPFTRKIPS